MDYKDKRGEDPMKKTGLWMLVALGVWLAGTVSGSGQTVPKALTLLYSNSQFGEIDPCPT
jgi:hypothetical protein